MAKDGTIKDVFVSATPLVDAEGKFYAIATTEREAGKDDQEEKLHDKQ